jgi:hypothetical protein
MATRLVFIHGRAQQGKDAATLKKDWIRFLQDELAKKGKQLPITEDQIRFPYYGDALSDRVEGKPADQVAAVIIKGAAADVAKREFLREVLEEVRKEKGITDEQLLAIEEAAVLEKGILNLEWVQRILRAIDEHIEGASAASIAIATNDVYEYLFNPNVTRAIDDGVREVMADDVPIVVVSHSLGTVIGFKILKEMAKDRAWKVPLFVTLGSPLAVTAIRTRLRPLVHPPCVGAWFNAMDQRDVVSLYPLDKAHFNIIPEIENKTDVDNPTENRHGISGYLGDADVAARIYKGLTT